jgi:hypothetical protein
MQRAACARQVKNRFIKRLSGQTSTIRLGNYAAGTVGASTNCPPFSPEFPRRYWIPMRLRMSNYASDFQSHEPLARAYDHDSVLRFPCSKQSGESARCKFSVAHRMRDVLVPEIILDQSGVCAPVCEGISAWVHASVFSRSVVGIWSRLH